MVSKIDLEDFPSTHSLCPSSGCHLLYHVCFHPVVELSGIVGAIASVSEPYGKIIIIEATSQNLLPASIDLLNSCEFCYLLGVEK